MAATNLPPKVNKTLADVSRLLSSSAPSLNSFAPRVFRQRQPNNNNNRNRGPKTPAYLNVFTEIVNAITTSASRPLFLLAVFTSVAVILSNPTDLDNGPFAKIFPSSSTNPFLVWARQNIMKIVGVVIFAPIIVDAPTKIAPVLAVATAIWIFIVPEASVIEYVIQAFAIHLYLHLRSQAAKFTVIGLTAIAFSIGMLPSFHRLAEAGITDSPFNRPSSDSNQSPASVARNRDHLPPYCRDWHFASAGAYSGVILRPPPFFKNKETNTTYEFHEPDRTTDVFTRADVFRCSHIKDAFHRDKTGGFPCGSLERYNDLCWNSCIRVSDANDKGHIDAYGYCCINPDLSPNVVSLFAKSQWQYSSRHGVAHCFTHDQHIVK